ncbi:flagellar filament capping protein FliD [Demequina mangrovi]|uniref:Flagellar hook-associated protein 2 n=1 Tax=Demequina mangrovi TaxID=1043493 RepID=A0A1H6ZXU5_9MICO|nr:flagellar filament capping protein FliD [Demequina mangrovi]SEJ56447.1 flagellar hook-associated protein 2 [Demequina mangrovi]
MATLGVDGIASGLDTSSIISALMQIEAGPQTLLSRKKSTAQSVVSSLQSINTKIKALADAAATAAKASTWTTFKATSSSSAATATASTSAAAGSLTFSVDAVAKTQVSLSASVASGADLTAENPPTLTVKSADGTYASVTADSNSLADIAKAINDGDLGITATVVSTGSGTSRLQLTGTTTGTDGAFELYVGDEAAVTGGTATRLDSSVTRAASDAQITLWKGTSEEQTFTQSSNTFTGLMSGVDVTVSAVEEDVTVSVAVDASAGKTQVSGLVTKMTAILDAIDAGTKASSTTNDDGTTSVTGGILSGDALVRNMRAKLSEAMTYPIDGVSLSEYGIEVDRYGDISFDGDAFAAALAEDPDGVAEAMQTLAARVEDAADLYSDSYEGLLTQSLTTRQTEIESLASQISNWDTRLAARQEALYAKFTAMEVTLSSLNAQMDYITSALDSLPSISSSSK